MLRCIPSDRRRRNRRGHPDHRLVRRTLIVAPHRPDARIATEEVFGPVTSLHTAASLHDALTLANDSDYGLTGGVFSRSPRHIRRVAAELNAGNVYINRAITGSMVGRQPFGGLKLSGVASKVGGPDYLLQFVEPVSPPRTPSVMASRPFPLSRDRRSVGEVRRGGQRRLNGG